ncbi:MAG TPA: NfeD family protein [Thermoanaerobaculia bacterium]|nr:NfeD family protein [Thermoanaerobaculia bacterium]
MDWWIWTLIGFFFLALEFVTTTLHSAFFAAGAFLVAILVAVHLDLPLWAQLLIFTLFSLVTLLLIRPLVVRKLKLSRTIVVDTMVGEKAVAMEDIPAAGFGKAEMRGSTWNARNVGETALVRGQRCVVETVEGLVLHVKAG